jgi:hypothetical protein
MRLCAREIADITEDDWGFYMTCKVNEASWSMTYKINEVKRLSIEN